LVCGFLLYENDDLIAENHKSAAESAKRCVSLTVQRLRFQGVSAFALVQQEVHFLYKKEL